jgi:hypothetical protein
MGVTRVSRTIEWVSCVGDGDITTEEAVVKTLEFKMMEVVSSCIVNSKVFCC